MDVGASVELPRDALGRPVRPGDAILLRHNGREVTVRSLEYLGGGRWNAWPHGGGGAVAWPGSRWCVERVDPIEPMLLGFAEFAMSHPWDAVEAEARRIAGELAEGGSPDGGD